MWTYLQTGTLIGPDDVRHPAYSGRGEHKNVPKDETLEGLGPIPCGLYHIGDPVDTVRHGDYVLPLTPDPGNVMFGRTSFLIHGDSIIEPGTASKGCVIASLATRKLIGESGDHILQVLSGDVAVDPGMQNE